MALWRRGRGKIHANSIFSIDSTQSTCVPCGFRQRVEKVIDRQPLRSVPTPRRRRIENGTLETLESAIILYRWNLLIGTCRSTFSAREQSESEKFVKGYWLGDHFGQCMQTKQVGNKRMATRDIVVIGASSGGIEALTKLVRSLPSELPAAIFIVQHIALSSKNYLPEILARRTSLRTHLAEDDRRFERGRIYVAPANYHLLIDSDHMFLSQGPRENRVRPAIDPLFRSAALSHGSKVIGVILSGLLDDGTAGLAAIKKAGGLAVVQAPADALSPDMPQSALDHVDVDYSLAASEVGSLLGRLVAEALPTESNDLQVTADQSALAREVGIIREESSDIDTAIKLGRPIPASCPECGGPLWEIDGEIPRFRCHTGHAFTARHLVSGLQEAEETALWAALRVMEERVRMLQRLAMEDEKRGNRLSHGAFTAKAAESEQHVKQLRNLLNSRPATREVDEAI